MRTFAGASAALFMLCCGAALAARQDDLVEPAPIAIAEARTADEVERSIRRGVLQSGWTIEESSPERTVASRALKIHFARVTMNRSASAIAIHYLDSVNLGYEVEGSSREIHPTYNAWVAELVDAITATLANPPPAADAADRQPVAVLSDGCVLRGSSRRQYFLRDASVELGRSAARAAAQSLALIGGTVRKVVTPFVCGAINFEFDAPPAIADVELDGIAQLVAVNFPQPLDVANSDDALALAYRRLLESLTPTQPDVKTRRTHGMYTIGRTYNNRVLWPRALVLDPSDRIMLTQALGAQRVWVLRIGAFVVADNDAFASALGQALVGPAVGKSESSVSHDIALVDLDAGQVLWHRSVRGKPVRNEVAAARLYTAQWFAAYTTRRGRHKFQKLKGSDDLLRIETTLDEEVAGLGELLASRNKGHWEIACRELPYTAIADAKLFERIEQVVADATAETYDPTPADYVGYCARALASSGDAKYLPALQRFVAVVPRSKDRRERQHEEKERNARQQIADLLPKFAAWNPVIANEVDPDSEEPPPVRRTRNMLLAQDPALQDEGRRRAAVISRHFPQHAVDSDPPPPDTSAVREENRVQ